MPKLIDLLKSLGTKSKLDLTKAEFAAVLESAKDIDVPEDFATEIESALMTEDAAVNNLKVRNRVGAAVLNKQDAYLDGLIDEIELDDSAKAEIRSEKDTYRRYSKTIKVLNEAKKVAGKAGDKGTEQAYKTQVQELQAKMKADKEEFQAQISKIEAEREREYVNTKILNILGVEQYAISDHLTPEEKIEVALMHAQKELAKNKYKVIKTDDDIKLVNLDGTEPFDDKHNPVTLRPFLKGVVATKGLLKNSDPSQGGNGSNLQHIHSDVQQRPINHANLTEAREKLAASMDNR